MFVLRCILSGLFALGGAGFFLSESFDSWLLLWFIAAAVLPYDAMKKIFSVLAVPIGIYGVGRLLYFDFFEAFLGIGIVLIIGIKARRFNKEEKRMRRYRIGYSGGIGTYSSGSYDYAAREQQMSAEEDIRRRRDEEFEEERRRRQEAFEAESRRREAENLSQRKYGCDANTASQWDKDIRNRL
ncbi:MAG: hypothetical protein K2N38_05075 [Oscillospiraceae bacterium]|nr:hypothetical protein [Oscillospiraceae bacterium]